MKPLTKQDVIDIFKELDKHPITFPKDMIVEEIDGRVLFKHPDSGAVHMSMPREDFDTFMEWDGKT